MVTTVAVPCSNCKGTGEVQVEVVECSATTTVGRTRHEVVKCWANRQHPGHPHVALLCGPCAACGGYDEHDDKCPRGDETTTTYHWFSWTDEQWMTLKRMDDEEGEAWCAEFFPRGL